MRKIAYPAIAGAALVGAALMVAVFAGSNDVADQTDSNAPKSANPQPRTTADESKLRKATFASGCFWCTEAVFDQLKGVKSVESGYTGGLVVDPTYEQVCSG